jgi:hypothetical protein
MPRKPQCFSSSSSTSSSSFSSFFSRKKCLVNTYHDKKNGEKINWKEIFEKYESGAYSFSQLSTFYSIPLTAIQTRYKRYEKDEDKLEGLVDKRFSGFSQKKHQILSNDQERILLRCIHSLRKRGFKINSSSLIREVRILFPSCKDRIGIHWVKSFCRKHKIVRRKATPKKKAWNLNEWNELGKAFHDECKSIIEKNSLMENDVANFDEIRFVIGR